MQLRMSQTLNKMDAHARILEYFGFSVNVKQHF